MSSKIPFVEIRVDLINFLNRKRVSLLKWYQAKQHQLKGGRFDRQSQSLVVHKFQLNPTLVVLMSVFGGIGNYD